MKTLLRLFALPALFAMLSAAGVLPAFYQKVDRVLWVVGSLDRPSQEWTKLGMTAVHHYSRIALEENSGGNARSSHIRLTTGHLGSLTVDFIEPGSDASPFDAFLSRHGDGIFAILHPVPDAAALTRETDRLARLQVPVLARFTIRRDNASMNVTLFDTESRGKYVLGLVYWQGGAPVNREPVMVSHIAPVIRQADPVSAFWTKLGFPPLTLAHATPRDDSRYRGKPLLLAFDVAWQRHTEFTYEWIIPPAAPPNIYVDYLKRHGEGVQHLGLPVDDLEAAIARYAKLGYSVWQSGAWGDLGQKNSGRYAYMDTDASGGVCAELIHANR